MPDRPFPLDLERLQLSPEDIERRKVFVDFQPGDLPRIAAIKDLVVRDAQRYGSTFFDYLADIKEASGLTRNLDAVDRDGNHPPLRRGAGRWIRILHVAQEDRLS